MFLINESHFKKDKVRYLETNAMSVYNRKEFEKGCFFHDIF